MPNTKTCPGCKNNVKSDAITCAGCGFDFLADECPGCGSSISLDADKCPSCGYNLVAPAKSPKPPKEPKQPREPKTPRESKRTAVKEEVKSTNSKIPAGFRHIIITPALGRYGQPPIDFPELHFKAEPTDEAILEWAENLRYAWRNQDGERGYLSNHAVVYIALNEPKLKKLSLHILQLLGGEDC